MVVPHPNDIRYRVDPGDVPAEKAARRLHLTLKRFNEVLPDLLKRGFPPADPTTGMFDLDAIGAWGAIVGLRLFHPMRALAMELFCWAPGGQPVEAKLHHAFRRLRSARAWFNAEPDLFAVAANPLNEFYRPGGFAK